MKNHLSRSNNKEIIPPDILEHQRRKKHFETYTPIYGLLLVGACPLSMILLNIKNMTWQDFGQILPFVIVWLLITTATYVVRVQNYKRWEHEVFSSQEGSSRPMSGMGLLDFRG